MLSSNNWYAVSTRPNAEKKVFERLSANSYEAYLPLVSSIREWTDRKKKIESPLISTFVFVKLDPTRIYDVLKFGPNLDTLPKKDEIGENFEGHIKLLLLGVNWEMKGGDLAFGAFKILLDKGYNVSFTVCGCVPPITHEKMTVIPFLNKNSEEDLVKFRQLMFDSHLLILPTRIDCAPIVFCEAAAYGIPVVTTDTGGVSCIINENVTGYTLPLEAGPEAYAERIQYLIDHPEKMTEMALRSREEFENELNWDVWGMKMKKILMDLLRQA